MARQLLIVEDDALVLKALSALLASRGSIATASSAQEAMARLASRHFDVAILDHRLGEGSGIEIAGEIARKCYGVRVILVTAFATKRVALQAVNHHVFGIVEKPFDPPELLALVDRALDTADTRLAMVRKCWALTNREAEVLELVARGTSNRAIADELGCSERTIEVHITRLLEKAGVESRTALVARYFAAQAHTGFP